MRIVYSLGLLVMVCAALMLVYRLRNEKDKTIRQIRRMLFCCVGSMIVALINVWSLSKTISTLGYSLYFALMCWVMLFFFEFCLDYTGRNWNWARIAGGAVSAALSISWLLNPFLHHILTVMPENWGGRIYMIFVPNAFFTYHFLGGLLIIVCSLILLITKSIECPLSYKIKYLAVAAMATMVGTFHGVFVMLRLPIDWSILFYAPAALVWWYLASRYTSIYLLSRALSVTVDRLDTGIALFDYQGNCLFSDERSLRFLGSKPENAAGTIEKLFGTQDTAGLTGDEKQICCTVSGMKTWLSISYRELKDSSDIYEGCFITMQDITEQVTHMEEEKYRTTHDDMTNLLKREAFETECRKILEGNPFEDFVMVQITTNGYDTMGDIYGLDIRNAIVSGVGSKLQKLCAADACACRMQAADFGLLIPKQKFDGAELLASIRKMMLEIMGENARTFAFRLGVSDVTERFNTVRSMINRSKAALSHDRESSIVWYSSNMREQGVMNSNLSGELPEALRNHDIKMYLQADLDREGKIAGAEALVRWHRNGEVLKPYQFLPLFERSEQIADVDRYICEQACICLKKWEKEGHPELFICVNIARKDLYLMNLVEELSEMTRKYEVEPSRLRLDFSAEVLAQEGAQLNDTVVELKKAGFIVSLDNFGSDKSAPLSMKNADFDGLKICRALICGIETDKAGRAITRAILNAAREIGVEVTAEGVETERELKSLQSMGCSYYQGFFISEPIPQEEFEQSFLSEDAVDGYFGITETEN